MKWILKNNTNKPLVRVFCFVSFYFFLIYQPYFLPVPSLASRAFRFILAIRITSVWLWHYVSLPWWWQRVFPVLEWGGHCHCPLKGGWQEGAVGGLLPWRARGKQGGSASSAELESHVCNGCSLWPCSLVSVVALLSLSGRLCVMCQPFREKT